MTPKDKMMIKKGSNTNSEFASLIVIGFRPKEELSDQLSIESSYVCVPPPILSNDTSPEEASNHSNNYHAVASLFHAMCEENVVLVGELLTRVTSTSRIVAMWPLSETIDQGKDEEDGSSSVGMEWPEVAFLASPLPFADEVRSAKENDVIEEEAVSPLKQDELVDAFASLVEKQTLQGSEIGESFQNAHLVQYWEYVEKLAHQESLDNHEEDEKRDYEGTLVDEDELMRITKSEIETIQSLLPDEELPTRKKSASQGKRKKTPPHDDSGVDWMDLFQNKEVGSANVAQLKSKLKSLGEPVAGKKALLVERVTKHLQKEWELEAKVKSEH